MSDVSTMMFVERPDGPEPINALLYGPAGAGKTVGALSAPGPIALLNSDRPGGPRFARRHHSNTEVREVRFTGRQTLNQFVDYLRRPDADEQTVVIDTLGEIHKGVLREVGGAKPQIQHYGTANTVLEDFCRALRDLSLNVVVVCHEQIDDNEEGGATRRPLTGGTKLPETVMGMMDVVAYCGVVEPEQKGGEYRYLGQLVQSRGRRAKDGTGTLGASRALDLTEWIDVAHKALEAPDELPFDEKSGGPS